VYLRALAVWLLLVALAIANGALREGLLTPRFGPGAAHVASTLLLSAVILAVASATIRWIGPRSSGDAWRVGFLWLALVLAFEFGFGWAISDKSFAELLGDYDLSRGRIWPLVPIVTALAPRIAARIVGIAFPKLDASRKR